MLKRKEHLTVIHPIQNWEMPLHLLPNLGDLLQAYQAKNIQVLSPQNFEKQTLHSRYSIASANKVQSLSVPIHHSSRGLPFHEAKIDYQQKWVKDHKQAWQSAYGKSAFFEFYDYRFFDVLDQQIENLEELSKQWLSILHQNLGWPSQLDFQTENKHQPNATIPTNSIAVTTHIPAVIIQPYAQVFEHKFGFRSEISAIDLLFNLGPLAQEYIHNAIFVNSNLPQ